jgi:hypothetical protein
LNSLPEISSSSLLLVFVTVEMLSFGEIMLPRLFVLFYVSALRFVHWRPSHLLVLITCKLSVEIFLMFRQDSVVTRLKWPLPLDWGYGLVAKDSPAC